MTPKAHLVSYKAEDGKDSSFAESVTELAVGAVKSVETNLNRQLRYGRVTEGPIAVDYLDGHLGNVGRVRTLVVVAVFPATAVAQISGIVQDAIEIAFKQEG